MSDWRSGLSKKILDSKIILLETPGGMFSILCDEGLLNVRQITTLTDEQLVEIPGIGEKGLYGLVYAIGELCVDTEGIMPETLRQYISSRRKIKEKKRDYCIYLCTWNSCYKIGVSGSVESRLRALASLPGVEIELVHKVRVGNANAYGVERSLHEKYQEYRVCDERFKEWFNLPPAEVAWFCSLKDGELDESSDA